VDLLRTIRLVNKINKYVIRYSVSSDFITVAIILFYIFVLLP
jgi:hypothetical protein